MNIYANYGLQYIKKGFSAIPGKYGSKQPAIKGWSDYCYKLPTEQEYLQWANSFEKTNLDIALGEASSILALDFDCTDPKIIELIEHLLPESPVERKGAKGWVRFFRYSGESSLSIKYNGEVVLEILSTNKKVTIPPSKHPSGLNYEWVKGDLLEVNKEDLPLLPIGLVAEINNKLKFNISGVTSDKPHLLKNGRNNALTTLCAKLIKEGAPVSEAIEKLINQDKALHETPLFTDINEFRHTEAFTNALTFYSNHLQSINAQRFRSHKEYEIPITASAVNETYVEEILKKKEQKQECQKKYPGLELPSKLPGALHDIYQYIIQNSFVPQPAFALSAALGIMATIIGRKVMFQGAAPNLYLLNIAPSGSGKDAPLQEIKKVLTDINAFYLLGAGDYVSDASLMDELSTSPVRIDVIDEASGLLKGVTTGGAGYNGKMADILCELYSCSTSRFLGRMTAEGRKGVCDRPSVSLYCSTTPAGFRDSITKLAIEKGLLGRFLIFEGNPKAPARQLKNRTPLSYNAKDTLLFWKNWQAPKESSFKLGEVSQNVYTVESNQEADELLYGFFKEIDQERILSPEDSPYLPIISRLYQQTLKIALISACARIKTGSPIVEKEDVIFAKTIVSYYRSIMKNVVDQHIFSNETEANYVKLWRLIQNRREPITQRKLHDKTRWLKPRERDSIIQELLTDKKVVAFHNKEGALCFLGADAV